MNKTHACKTILLLSVLFFVPLTRAAAQGRDEMLPRTFDVSRLTAVHRQLEGWPLMPPLLHAYREVMDASETTWRVTEGGFSADMVLDIIHTAMPGRFLDDPGTLSAVIGGGIFIRQRREVLDRVERLLDALTREAVPEIRVNLFTIPAGALRRGEARPLLDRAGVAALLRKGSVVEAASGFALPGGAQLFRSGSERAFVGDYDVEVAQEAQIADPRIFVLSLGLDMKVEVRPLPGGNLLVRAAGRLGDLLDMRTIDPESSYVGKISLPVVASQCVAGSGVIPSGGGIVLGWSREETDRLILVQVEMREETPRQPASPVTLIPGGLVGTVSWNLPEVMMPGVGSSRLSADRKPASPESFRILEGDLVLEGIRKALGDETFRQKGRSLFWERPYIVVVGPRELGAQVAGLVGDFHAGLTDSRVLEVRCGVVEGRRAALLASGQGDLEGLAASLPGRGYAATRVGDELRLQSGVERAYLMDHDVEIAQEAQIADPITDVVFEGMVLTGRLQGGPGAGLVFSGEFAWRGIVDPIATFQGNADDVGVVELPSAASWRSRVTVPLAPGRWALLGTAPLPSGKGGLAVLIRTLKP